MRGEHGIFTGRPFEVAPDGEAVVYAGDSPPTGGGGSTGLGGGDQYLAARSPGGGWTAADIQPPVEREGAKYLAFSTDLSVGVFFGEGLAAGELAGLPNLYSHTTADGGGGKYVPVFTRTPPERSVGEFSGAVYAGTNAGRGVGPSASNFLFSANDALLEGEGTLEKELKEDVKKDVEEGKRSNVLYDSVGGRLNVVNVLPNGKTDANASFGTPPTGSRFLPRLGLSHVMSADGSRIFWTDLNTEVTAENPTGATRLFVRENDASPEATTVQVDASVGGGGRFLTANSEGTEVFFTKGDLYEYDVNSGQTTDLTPGVEVQGVLGASEDGSYVYFAAGGVLATGATPGTCKEANGSEGGTPEEQKENREEEHGQIPPGRACNLYLFHRGEPLKLIATLAAVDGRHVPPFIGGQNYEENGGDWRAAIGDRTAEVTRDGHSLVFMSNRSLTGYNNTDKGVSLDEVFLYHAGELNCVSCNPSGEAPVATEFDAYHGPLGGFFPITKTEFSGNTYQPRVVSEDGGRVFFDSAEPLAPQDVNGWLDVYEWEGNGTGSCREAGGCIYLLSGGTSPENSYLLGASANGNDAFIITRAQLVPLDRNENDDVYDVRVGGVRPPPPIACSGTGCQGVPPAQPIFATPSSATFNGVGNFPPLPNGQVKPKHKPKPKKHRVRKKAKRKSRKATAKKKGKR
jgi:hypothetical protein